MNARQYRDHLYRLRAHPKISEKEVWVDRRDSFLTVYFSIIPFLAAEYFIEISSNFPTGIVFPLGYLLFWAFYYTYYKPDVLEEHLSTPKKWDLRGIPVLLLGVAIWFVKVTLVELSRILFLRKFFERSKPKSPPRAYKPHPGFPPNARSHHYQSQSSSGHQARGNRTSSGPRRSRPVSTLPAEILQALQILGLHEGASWLEIQHRYRELAKSYHPDLNPEITSAGRRFMMFNAAYRKLETFRAKDFSVRK